MEEKGEQIIDRLRKGKTVKCLECKKGKYITNSQYINIANDFWCDKCGSIIRVSPNVIVE